MRRYGASSEIVGYTINGHHGINQTFLPLWRICLAVGCVTCIQKRVFLPLCPLHAYVIVCNPGDALDKKSEATLDEIRGLFDESLSKKHKLNDGSSIRQPSV